MSDLIHSRPLFCISFVVFPPWLVSAMLMRGIDYIRGSALCMKLCMPDIKLPHNQIFHSPCLKSLVQKSESKRYFILTKKMGDLPRDDSSI